MKGKLVTLKNSVRLPVGYTEVEYIESTGTQYIDTGIPGTTAYGLYFEFMPTSLSGNFQNYLTGYTDDITIGAYGSLDKCFVRFRRQEISHELPASLTQFNRVEMLNGTLTWNNLTFNITADVSLGMLDDTIYLCLNKYYPNIIAACKIKILRLYDNTNSLLRELIPCYRKSDNKPGLYDLVNNQFYTNQGTGEFITGPEVLPYHVEEAVKSNILYRNSTLHSLPNGYTEVEYLQSTGTQYIDTGVAGNTIYGIRTKFLPISNAGTWQEYLGNGSSFFLAADGNQIFNCRLFIQGSMVTTTNLDTGILNVFECYSGSIKLNEYAGTYSTSQPLSATSNNLLLFMSSNVKGAVQFSTVELYDSTNTLIRNMVPCYRNSDNKPGMYDLVGEQFYTNAGTGSFVVGNVVGPYESKLLRSNITPLIDNYSIRFVSTSTTDKSFSLYVLGNSKTWNGIVEVSFDGNTWMEWDPSVVNSISSGENGIIYVRGVNNTYITGSNSTSTGPWRFTLSDTNSKIECYGNIENLLDYQTVALGNHPTIGVSAFDRLFFLNNYLSVAPDLGSTTLNNYCYRAMFEGSGIDVAPELPATNLAQGCYTNMFRNTKITTAPALPATTLASYCYDSMFYNCSYLVNAPELPALNLSGFCYGSMFKGCTALVIPPELPATTLDTNCYAYMFYDCKSLQLTPELPATTLTQSCYQFMFTGCIALTTVPKLKATVLTGSCYSKMFQNCTNISTLPAIPATTLASYNFEDMFNGCSLIKISETQTGEYVNEYRIPPQGTATGEVNTTFIRMFANTGGTFTGTPQSNTTYYTSNEIIS